MAATQEPGEDDDADEIPEVQALGGWVEAAVDPEGRESWVGTSGPEIVAGEGLEQTSFFQDFDDIGAVD